VIRACALAFVASATVGCGEPAGLLHTDAPLPPVPYAAAVESFEPGVGAGYGQESLPGVVLGPPAGGATSRGSEDVVSLGQGGTIVLRLGLALVDGDGPDLIVFENPFLYPGGVFAEPGQVSVSTDGEAWAVFDCEPTTPAPNGCAGYEPVLAGDSGIVDATDPVESGGDLFDLAWLEDAPPESWFVRIVDRGADRIAPTAGFDLDAVAVVRR
jgi:hypothetical protein